PFRGGKEVVEGVLALFPFRGFMPGGTELRSSTDVGDRECATLFDQECAISCELRRDTCTESTVGTQYRGADTRRKPLAHQKHRYTSSVFRREPHPFHLNPFGLERNLGSSPECQPV